MEIKEVKGNLNKLVKYKNNDYIFTGCVFRRKNDDFYYQAELKEKNINSIIICKLGDVKNE